MTRFRQFARALGAAVFVTGTAALLTACAPAEVPAGEVAAVPEGACIVVLQVFGAMACGDGASGAGF